ncbi:CcmD family protein [Hymenobacter negativus]|uniref:CcmD family protein n=1 Tax=Hymenobacter negativus TaxID=2795026 RepID=A0ABS0QBR5_9BACT|nr:MULTISPECIES: CcmD family protein [Bacteria]MBH8560114.1 CcmD family protein [Hymenobacter negativus]MBH8568191.1 CcmD family protein [Hymenobacter negativus]MBR7207926.1 CcmD family protein [Microvirga sp. STS02]
MKNNLLARLFGAFGLLQLLLFTATTALAQAPGAEAPEMADALRANGKIYVVVAAVVIIVAGLLFYLISLDRKVSKLEKEIK